MPQDSSRFAERFLKRLRRIDPDQVEGFIAQVLREKSLMEEVLDRIEEGLVLVDRQGRIFKINRAASQMLTIRRTDAEGKAFAQLVRVEGLRHLIAEHEEGFEPIRNREVLLASPRSRALAVSALPIEEGKGISSYTLWLIVDRSEEDRRAEERQQMGRLESLAALTAGVAHEVKNPLNSLNIHAQLLRSGMDRLRGQIDDQSVLDRLSRSTQVMMDEIQRLARVVDDFTRAVRPVEPSLRGDSINRVIQSLAELVGPACAERGIELVLQLDGEIPDFPFDNEQIHQALLNILKNAMESIDKPDARIDIRTSLRSEHVLVEIEDNGCGIREADRLKIFEPYHTTKFDGTGLGLMVVYRIVRAHRGAIGLSSEVGVGTCFSIALPLDERPVRLLTTQIEPQMLEG